MCGSVLQAGLPLSQEVSAELGWRLCALWAPAVAGARVILCSRSVEAGQKVAEQLKADGGIKVCHLICGSRRYRVDD